jgi:HAD superfamily hydrolase (TIGR01490 family)
VTQPVAFFDVDETLIGVKSMFDFLDYHRRHGGAARPVSPPAGGAPGSRAELNRAYYRAYAGVCWARLLDDGRRWYADLCRRPRPFVAGGLQALLRHRAAGHTVVLVSGSFLPCLGPLARHLGADTLVCARPEVTVFGTLTGEIRQPLIGPAKAAAAMRILAERQVDPAGCFAYGDHASDLDLLEVVGRPHVVGVDPILRRIAGERGWPVLAADLVPAPPVRQDLDFDVEGMTL